MFPKFPRPFQLISAILLILCLRTLAASARRRIYHKALTTLSRRGIIGYIHVGNPPQTLRARFNTDLYDLIVMDLECTTQQVAKRCPRYCSNSEISQLVGCSPKCETIGQSHVKNRCAHDGAFWANEFDSFKDLGTELRGHYQINDENRDFLGRRASDRIMMAGWGVIGGNRMEFTRGMLFDTPSVNAFIGLAASSQRPNLIQQLPLDHLIFAVSGRNIRTRMHSRYQNAVTITFGSVQKSECYNWFGMAAPIPHIGWKFSMGFTYFYGIMRPERNIAKIAFDSWHLGVPSAIIDELIHRGSLKPLPNGRFEIKNLNYLTFSFQFGTQNIALDSEILVKRMQSNGYEWYLANFVRNPPPRFADEADWTFGLDYLRVFCFGYDYHYNFTLMGLRRSGQFARGLIF